MSLKRTVKRNILKNQSGTNKIKETWRNMQIKRYGEEYWIKMFKDCVSREVNF
jgi:hypothetical protein